MLRTPEETLIGLKNLGVGSRKEITLKIKEFLANEETNIEETPTSDINKFDIKDFLNPLLIEINENKIKIKD